jgi:hypothetical protein
MLIAVIRLHVCSGSAWHSCSTGSSSIWCELCCCCPTQSSERVGMETQRARSQSQPARGASLMCNVTVSGHKSWRLVDTVAPKHQGQHAWLLLVVACSGNAGQRASLVNAACMLFVLSSLAVIELLLSLLYRLTMLCSSAHPAPNLSLSCGMKLCCRVRPAAHNRDVHVSACWSHFWTTVYSSAGSSDGAVGTPKTA